jgi:hypothetical protein
MRHSLDEPWPKGDFDLVVFLRGGLLPARRNPALGSGPRTQPVERATVVAAHWRHRVEDYPMSGDHTNQIIAATPGLLRLDSYRDPDVAIEIFTGPDQSASKQRGLALSSKY